MTGQRTIVSQPPTVHGHVRLCNSDDDYVAWDSFLFHFPGANYFQTYGWLKSYEPMGLTPQVLIYDVNGAIAGGVAFLSAKLPLLPFRIFIIPHGPLPANPDAASWLPLMRRLDEICQEGNAIYAQLYPHEVSQELVLLPRLEQLGFTSPPLFTLHDFTSAPVTVDLSVRSEEHIAASFRKKTRQYIRHALNTELELRTDLDSVGFDKIYGLFVENGRLMGYQPRPYASLRAAWEWFAPKGWATILQAWHRDNLAGAIFLVFTGRTSYYLAGAVRREFAQQRPAEFMHWHGIRRAIALQLDRYDLVNSGGTPGVEQFKRGFRPQYRYWHAPRTKVYRPWPTHVVKIADHHLRPVLRVLGRWRARSVASER